MPWKSVRDHRDSAGVFSGISGRICTPFTRDLTINDAYEHVDSDADGTNGLLKHEGMEILPAGMEQ